MKSRIQAKDNNPNYLIISLALIKSEVFWICSVLWCVLRGLPLLPKEKPAVHVIYKRKIKSKPIFPTIENTPKPNNADHYRRMSLPVSVHIRSRPSIHDEINGTTCPPIWWQKTRVKLGRAPVHGDPRQTISMLEERTANTEDDSTCFSVQQPQQKSILPSISSSVSTISTDESHIPLSQQTTNESSNSTSPKHKNRLKKFATKLNNAFHNIPSHQRFGSIDSKKST
ncbi:MAG: hypothetical protein EXX96DRAFT_567988 [Benjaminiella poitrasii]|nr:MAG: hypothetical protein EXX96DRAFT_567988 [Benjaminiella poitrasii]